MEGWIFTMVFPTELGPTEARKKVDCQKRKTNRTIDN